MIVLTWAELMNDARSLACIVKLTGKPIWGIPRGGKLLASLMSYWGCELVATPRPNPFVLQPENAATQSSPIIIDDIADTGETLKPWAEKGFETAVLIARAGCLPMPDTYIRYLKEKDYVAFPYESLAEAAEMEKKGAYKSNET